MICDRPDLTLQAVLADQLRRVRHVPDIREWLDGHFREWHSCGVATYRMACSPSCAALPPRALARQGEGVRMNDKEQELLAQFHHPISEQLNSRLSESPKFFGLLVVVSTGYGYVLSSPLLYKQKEVFFLASLLSYAAVL
jgi:hypothetical protein